MTYLKFLLIQIKRNFSRWFFWVLIWSFVGGLFVSVFNLLSDDEELVEEFIAAFPEEVLSGFNIDTNYLTDAESFLSGEFLSYYTLIGGIYAFMFGANLIANKIEDGSITLLITKHIPRSHFYGLQGLISLIFFSASSIAIWSVLFILFEFFSNQEELSTLYFYSAGLSTTLLFLAFAGLGQAFSLMIERKMARTIGIGVIVFAWFINSLSSVENFPEWLEPLSPFYYLNAEMLREDYMVDIQRLNVIIIAYIITIIVGIYTYRRKDLYL